MSAIINTFDMNRFVSNTGGIVGATVKFYYSGTSNLAPVYNDKALTSAAANPLSVAAGAIVPLVYLDSNISYRRRVELADGTVSDIDPVPLTASIDASAVTYGNRTVAAALRDWTSTANYASLQMADAAANGQTVLVTPGNYVISSNTTLVSELFMQSGAVITVNSGVTLTITGIFNPGPRQVFNCIGTGQVVFNNSKTWFGYAEWWGAVASAGVDSAPAINAALNALLFVQLNAGDYKIGTTIKMTKNNRTLAGVYQKYHDSVNEATRILCADGSIYGIQIGPDTFPGSINALQKENVVRDLYINRLVPPVIATDCVGIMNQYTLYTRIERVKVSGCMRDFRFYGTVSTKVRDCEAVRSEPGTGTGTDYWIGFYADGTANIGAAGGNASLYFFDCSANCNFSPAGDTNGFYANQAFTDLFFRDPESTNCKIGINIVGTLGNLHYAQNTDCLIDHPIMDQVHVKGIFISNLAIDGTVDIISPYTACASDGRATLHIAHSKGAINVFGGQLEPGPAQGLILEDCSGVAIRDTIFLESASSYPVVGLIGPVLDCDIHPKISNNDAQAGVAVQLSGVCQANRIGPRVKGRSNAFTLGIQVVGTGDDRNQYDLTGLNSTCIQGGSGNKLVRNGTQITATGLSGTNLVAGVTT